MCYTVFISVLSRQERQCLGCCYIFNVKENSWNFRKRIKWVTTISIILGEFNRDPKLCECTGREFLNTSPWIRRGK